MSLADLKRKAAMLPAQLAVAVVGTGLGVPLVTMAGKVVEFAGQSAWISLLLAAFIFGVSACGVVRLSLRYPGDTFVEYLPKMLGSRLGMAAAVYIFLLFCLEYCVVLRGFTDIIVTSLFDRTPFDVIAMTMLAMSGYGAMQKWGTVLRIVEYFVVTAVPVVVILSSAMILNFNIENVMPFWPETVFPVLAGVLQSTGYFAGYKLLLLVMPVTYAAPSCYHAVGGAFVFLGLTYAMIMLAATGVLGVNTINVSSYPIITAIRGVEIPGIFLERLENYMLLAWIPIAFNTLLLILFCAAQAAMRLTGQTDHRPHVLAVLPFLFILAMQLDRQAEFDAAMQAVIIMEIFLAWGLIPLCVLLVWLRRKNG